MQTCRNTAGAELAGVGLPHRTPTECMSFAELYRHACSSVVCVQVGEDSGSGFFLDPRGLVATCRHVVGQAAQVRVVTLESQELPAKVVRSFRTPDLAFLIVPEGAYASLEFEKPGDLLVGQEVAAIGHPRGFANSFSRGVVSGLGRRFRGVPHLQTDAATNPGSSGGPLLARSGRVAGICSSGFVQFPGLSFAIPGAQVLPRFLEIQRHFDLLREALYCTVCGEVAFEAARFCESCGSTIRQIEIPAFADYGVERNCATKHGGVCPICRFALAAADLYCGRCGASSTAKSNGGSRV